MDRWNRFFYGPADPRVYASLRIGFGVLLFVSGVVLGLDWLKWFSEGGILDPESARRNIDSDTWSVFWWLPGSPKVLWTCYALFMLQILALIVGFYPRFQAACLFVWLLSLHHRNNLIWDGEDVLFRIICFLLIWMPLGRVWSIDSKRKSPNGNGDVPAWPLRLLQIELTCLYFSAVLSKLSGTAWRDGTALYYVSKLGEFSGRMPITAGLFEIMWLVAILTWLTIAVELLLVFGVWVPKMRLPTVVIGMLFHLGIELTMNLFLFQWLMILILSTHLRYEDWEAVGNAFARFNAVLKGRISHLSATLGR